MNERFPIIGGPSIPWAMIAPHERQAKDNHDQSLERLAERGGLAPYEAVAALESRKYSRAESRVDQAAARARLSELVREFERNEASKLRVVAAAIRQGVLVFSVDRPGRHHDIVHRLPREFRPAGAEEFGFLLSDGAFATREHAWTVAEAAGQLLERAPTDKRGGTLYSEDVW